MSTAQSTLASAPASWVKFADEACWHPASKIFPLMGEAELQDLAEDIRAHGLLNPVVIHQDLLLDGRNRILACQIAGVEPTLVDWDPPDGVTPTEWVISQNLKRRHLDQSQAAACARMALPLLEAEARERQHQARVQQGHRGAEGGRGKRKTLQRKNATKGFRHVEKSSEKAAALFGVGARYVQAAKFVDKHFPEALRAVRDGKIKIPVAVEIARLEADLRAQALEEAIRAGKSKALRAVRMLAQRARAAKLHGIGPAVAAPTRTVRAGEWWELGRHLLYCGDTSSEEFRRTLPRAALAFADPPYGAGVDDWDAEFVWDHDYLADVADVVAVTPGISSIFAFARKTAMPYRWSLATWIANSHARGGVGFGNWIYTALFSRASVHRNAQDFFKITIPLSDLGATGHEGRKPTEYIAWLIETFTRPGETVIDPFGGSGTTLLVAERLGRSCVMGEINPEFCAEIIARWEADTKGTARRSSSRA
jgi:ParB family chromosome partitioning protein